MASIKETTPPVPREWTLKINEHELTALLDLLSPAGGIKQWALDEGYDGQMMENFYQAVTAAYRLMHRP